MRWLVLFVVACRFEPGEVTLRDAEAREDAPPAVEDAPALDAPPPDARVCPPPAFGCVAFQCPSSTSCYYDCGNASNKASWTGARGSCAGGAINGCIVTINDQAEQDCITQHTTPSFQSYVWIGYRQSATTDEPAGNWAWECPPSSYVQPGWGNPAGEPTDTGGNEDCAALTGGGGWFDANCTGTARYVCEVQ